MSFCANIFSSSIWLRVDFALGKKYAQYVKLPPSNCPMSPTDASKINTAHLYVFPQNETCYTLICTDEFISSNDLNYGSIHTYVHVYCRYTSRSHFLVWDTLGGDTRTTLVVTMRPEQNGKAYTHPLGLMLCSCVLDTIRAVQNANTTRRRSLIWNLWKPQSDDLFSALLYLQNVFMCTSISSMQHLRDIQ